VSNAGAIGAGESAIPVLAADHHVVEGAELVAFITLRKWSHGGNDNNSGPI